MIFRFDLSFDLWFESLSFLGLILVLDISSFLCVIDRWTPTIALTRTATDIVGEMFLKCGGGLGF